VTGSPAQPWYQAAFGAHYPLLYAHRDEAEAAQCLALLPTLASLGDGPILDLGCGQGRHLGILRRQGLAVVGLDLSPDLLRVARQDLPTASLTRADMRRIPLGERSVSAVLSLFTAFGYFGSVAAHQPVVDDIARVLQPGGHWYLDFLDSDKVAADLAGTEKVTEREVGPLIIHERRRLAEGPRRVIKSVRVVPAEGQEEEAAAHGVSMAGLDYAEEVTLLSLAEIDELAAGAGLLRSAAVGDYDGGALVPGTGPRWILVYKKPEDEGTAR